MSFFAELKRRNVFKVAAAYLIVGWLIMQAGEVMSPALNLPGWVNSMLAFFLILGFPLAMFFAWAFEMTPEGLRKEGDVDRSQSVVQATGQKLNYTIIALLAVALGYFVWESRFQSDDVLQVPAEAEPVDLQSNTQPDPGVSAETPATQQQYTNSIAVLPFVNMSADTGNEYFSDGLSEELLNLLAKIPALKVAARTSSFYFKGKTGDIAEIGKQLRVAHVLEGSVRKSGNQVRITVQLIKTDDGYHLWSETYDRQLDNIFQIQDEIATAVVDALKITLLGEAPRSTETDPEAYRLYLEGQYFYRLGSLESIGKSIDLLKQAVAIDDRYTPAWTNLANAYIWYTGIGGIPIDEGSILADQAIEMALAIDPDYAPVYVARSGARIYNKLDFNAGLQDALHASKLDPGNADALSLAGTARQALGQFDRAIKFHLAAIRLDPIQPALYEELGETYYFSGQLDKAEAMFRKIIALSPEYTSAHYRLGRVLLKQGDSSAALLEMQQTTDDVYAHTGRAMIYHTLGNPQKSEQALNSLKQDWAQSGAYQVAEVYGYRGEKQASLEWLNRALDNRDGGLQSTLGNPAFESLIDEPGWEQFLGRLGLVEAWRAMPPEWGGPLE